MSKVLKFIAPILAAVILLTFFMSLLFVIHEAHHNCTGEDCPICARIEACISTVKNFVDLVTVALLLAILPALLILTSLPPIKIFGNVNSPVNLKVKLLN